MYHRLTMFMIGKFAITISFAVIYVYTAELFPTNVRHSLLGYCSMFGRIGSMLAPQTPLLVSTPTGLLQYFCKGDISAWSKRTFFLICIGYPRQKSSSDSIRRILRSWWSLFLMLPWNQRQIPARLYQRSRGNRQFASVTRTPRIVSSCQEKTFSRVWRKK